MNMQKVFHNCSQKANLFKWFKELEIYKILYFEKWHEGQIKHRNYDLDLWVWVVKQRISIPRN